MWEITGICKKTGKRVDVATATNEEERRTILREEERNYSDLRAVRVRVAA